MIKYNLKCKCGETFESCGHNTRGKDKILFDEVFKKSLELIN